MPADVRSFAAGNCLLELDGRPMGFLHSFEGGEPYIDVVTDVPTAGVIGKRPGQLHFAPITIAVPLGMDPLVYQWIEAMLERRPLRKSGAVVTANYNLEETSRLSFDDAMITEVRFPKLEGSSKDPGFLTVTIEARATRFAASAPGVKVQGPLSVQQKAWLTSTFRLRISGLESACTKVASIDPIVATTSPTTSVGASRLSPVTSAVAVSNVTVSASETVAADFAAAFDDIVLRGGPERSATIDLLTPDLSSALFTISMSNVGIVRVKREPLVAGSERAPRVGIELYCESIALSSSTIPFASPISAPAAPIIKPLSTTPPVRPL